jgi:hypothetical protein
MRVKDAVAVAAEDVGVAIRIREEGRDHGRNHTLDLKKTL